MPYAAIIIRGLYSGMSTDRDKSQLFIAATVLMVSKVNGDWM